MIWRHLLFAFCPVLLGACAPSKAPDRLQETRLLSIKIVDRTTEGGVGGATVWVRLPKEPAFAPRRFFSEDTSGVFLITDLPRGPYALSVRRFGYVAKDTLIKSGSHVAKPVLIRLEQAIVRLQ